MTVISRMKYHPSGLFTTNTQCSITESHHAKLAGATRGCAANSDIVVFVMAPELIETARINLQANAGFEILMMTFRVLSITLTKSSADHIIHVDSNHKHLPGIAEITNHVDVEHMANLDPPMLTPCNLAPSE